MYRPQFVYPRAPKGSRFQRCAYCFDASNTAAFAGNIAAGNPWSNPIPLPTDQDADFLLRGIEVEVTNLQLALYDPFNRPLVSLDTSGAPGLAFPQIWCSTAGAGIVPLESDDWGLFCPRGSSMTAFIKNATAGNLTGPVILFHGVKMYCGESCR